ncbi:MAG: type VI secretion system-associated FHA domain protein TagH [Pseudomonadota bacterium]
MSLSLRLRGSGALPTGVDSVAISDGAITVGRGAENDLSLPDPTRQVSKRHCVIEARDGGYVLIDVSTNGTFVNHSTDRVGEMGMPVDHGDVILIGPYELVVEVAGQAPETTPDPFASAQLAPAPDPNSFARAPGGGVQTGGHDLDDIASVLDGPGDPVAGGGDDFLDDILGDGPAAPAPAAAAAKAQNPYWQDPHSRGDRLADAGPVIPDDDEDFLKGPADNPFQPGVGATPDHASATTGYIHLPGSVSGTDPASATPPGMGGSGGGGSLIPDDWEDDLLGDGASPAFDPPPARAQPTPAAAPQASPAPAAPIPARPALQAQAPQPVAQSVRPAQTRAQPPAEIPGEIPGGIPGEIPGEIPGLPDDDDDPIGDLLADASAGPQVTQQPMPPPRPAPAPAPMRQGSADDPFAALEDAPMAPPSPAIGTPAPAPPSSPAPPQAGVPSPGAPVSAGAESGARAFLEAAGIDTSAMSPEEMVETMARAGGVFRTLVEGFRDVLMNRAAIKGEFRMQQTQIRSDGNNPLKFSITPESAVEAMIQPTRRGFLEASESAREAARDIRAHEVATMTGMEAALKHLLAQVDPAELATRIETSGGLGGLFGNKKAKLWEAYETTYAKIAADVEDDFQTVFGREFARAYEDQLKKL